MNLGQLVDRVRSELQHDLVRSDVVAAINDEYHALLNSHRWPFRMAERSLRVYADRTVDPEFHGSPFSVSVDGMDDFWFVKDMHAKLVVIGDEADSIRRFGRVAGPVDPAFVPSVRVGTLTGWIDSTLLATAGGETAYLDAPNGDIIWATSFGPVSIRHDEYVLPYDVSEIVGVISRDDNQGMLELQDRSTERRNNISILTDPPGRPAYWMTGDALPTPMAPRKTMTSATQSGALDADVTYRYFQCTFWRGTFSAPGPVIEATGSTGYRLANFDALPVPLYGAVRAFFRSDGEDLPFVYVGSGDSGDSYFNDLGNTNHDIVWDDRMAAPQRTIRIWPRPSEDQWVDVQYIRTPNKLVSDGDVPQMPEEYHPILVSLALVRIGARYEQPNLVKLHVAMANEVRRLMVQREVAPYTQRHRDPWGVRRSGLTVRKTVTWVP